MKEPKSLPSNFDRDVFCAQSSGGCDNESIALDIVLLAIADADVDVDVEKSNLVVSHAQDADCEVWKRSQR
jgi:hypothetical protein